jgi:hypothetical protein
MTIFDQMGNIYSEVGRSFNAKRRQDNANYVQAVTRAIDLFDATIDVLIARHSPQSKEVLRAKEEFLNACAGNAKPEEIQSLDRYFMQFAIAARLNR